MRGISRIASVAAAMTAFLAATSWAATPQKVYSDDRIQLIIEHDLARKGIENVQVQVSTGNVTLSGVAQSVWARDQAADVAGRIQNVRQVTNNLTIARADGDDALAAQLRAKILRYVFYTVYDEIDLSVNNGIATLAGRVTMPFKAHQIAEFVSRERGVQGVRNEIKILPTSSFDDQLRMSIAAAIYRDLPEYATQAQPPIHVIVENGRVTLVGTVRSEVERRLAEGSARSSFGVLSVENRLQVGH